MVTEIELKFNRKDFEEIYFKDGKGDIFFGPATKGHFIIFLISSCALGISLLFSLLANKFWLVTIFLFLFFIATAYNYKKSISPILRWKKNIRQYLDDLSKYNKYKIILTDFTFSVIQDNNEIIEKWESILKVNITETHISLNTSSSEYYLFPKKSMSVEDYGLLKEYISTKFKNGL